MTEFEREAYVELSALLGEFAGRVDGGAAASTIDLFLPDAGFSIDSQEVGVAGLHAQMAQRQAAPFRTRHIVGAVRLGDCGDRRIRGHAVIEAHRLPLPGETGQPERLVSAWDVELATTGSAWKFARVSVQRFVDGVAR